MWPHRRLGQAGLYMSPIALGCWPLAGGTSGPMSDAEAAAYDAPFPDRRYKAGVRAFPNLVPDRDDAPGAALSRQAAEFWHERWGGDSFMAIGMTDPVLGPAAMHALRKVIRGCPEPMEVADGGHFLAFTHTPGVLADLA